MSNRTWWFSANGSLPKEGDQAERDKKTQSSPERKAKDAEGLQFQYQQPGQDTGKREVALGALSRWHQVLSWASGQNHLM